MDIYLWRICGGYYTWLSRNYTHGSEAGTQWVRTTGLPEGVLIKIHNSIYYRTRADIYSPFPSQAVYFSTMWEISLANPSVGWNQKNRHMSRVISDLHLLNIKADYVTT
jgi:hypothetical protein